MASPFFSSYWNQPSEARYPPSSIPLKRKPGTPSPKVISIPVHFVDSKNNRISSGLHRSDSALTIQRVLRGFLLRKSVNKIVKIRNEVDEIERRIARNESVELIRRDSKERLRINETLMALLFKLDSVRGIDSGVRELRKGVIRKAIALQERVDALVMRSPREIVDDPPVCDQEMPIEDISTPIENPPADISNDNMPIESDEMPIEIPPADISNDNMPIESDEMPIEDISTPIENPPAAISNDDMPPIESDEMPIENPPAAISNDNMPIENPPADISNDNMPIENVIESTDHSEDVEEEGNCVIKEIVEECNTMNSKAEIQKRDEEMDDCSKGVQQRAEEETGEVTTREEGGEKKSNEELQTRMIRMMSELVEKNELQTRMINSLTHRVGQLEKAFLCDKLRRSNKKKKRQHDAAADGKQ